MEEKVRIQLSIAKEKRDSILEQQANTQDVPTLEQLVKQLEEVNNIIAILEDILTGDARWRAEEGTLYFTVIIGGGVAQVVSCEETNTVDDYQHWANQNYYSTYEEAVEVADKVNKCIRREKVIFI